MSRFLLTFLTCGVMAASGAALAETAAPGVETKHVTVSYAGLDLQTSQGAQTLVNRIRQAAETACGPQPSSLLDLGGAAIFKGCVTRTMGTAVASIDAPLVTAAYAARTGRGAGGFRVGAN